MFRVLLSWLLLREELDESDGVEWVVMAPPTWSKDVRIDVVEDLMPGKEMGLDISISRSFFASWTAASEVDLCSAKLPL